MTTFTKSILALVGALIIAVAIYGGYQYPKLVAFGAAPAGSTFNDAKFAGVAINLASPGANGTSTSILNTDANTRYVTSFNLGCSGVGTSLSANAGSGIANLLVTVATSSAASPNALVGFSDVANALVVATTSVNAYTATSTIAAGQTMTASSSLSSVWPTNTYMTFFFNATNTALCTVGVHYIPG